MIDFQNVTKIWPGRPPVTALDGVSFRCEPGRVFALLGPNGSGKTTALRLIAALLEPTSGVVTVNGAETTKDPVGVKRHLGFLTSTTALYERLTPEELVRYFADLHELPREAARAREAELFARLDIASFARQRIGKLSLGMKQRVSIARALIHDPAVLVLDEPTTGLDVISSRAILDLIRECRAAGKTILFSTHIMGEVSLLADDMAILHQGRIRWQGRFPDFHAGVTGRSLEDEFIRIVEAAA